MAWQYSKEEFEKVVRTYGDDVFRLAYTRVGNADDAKDIYQSVFLNYIQVQISLNQENILRLGGEYV